MARMLSALSHQVIALAAGCAAMGCRPAEQIHTHHLPKATAPHVAAKDFAAEPADRMLAAIVPDDNKAWFFKIVAPLPEMDERADALAEFFASIRIVAGKPRPDWQLPEGWEEQPGSGMRVATILIPTRRTPLELSVTSLPWTGDQADLLSNVNRWRGQLQLTPIGPPGLVDCTREMTAGTKTLTVVDLRGRFESADMGAAGLGLPGAAGGLQGDASADSGSLADLPPGHPSFAESAAADPTIVEYEVPDGWQSAPASGMRKAAFRVADGAHEAMVTVIDLPVAAGPLVADPVANVNRWRSEVGMAPIAADSLSDATAATHIDEFQGIYIEAIPAASTGEEPAADAGTLAAMAPGGDVVWFVKITGDRELVIAQREQFQSFLKSIRLTALDESSQGD
jgi:hypothetical protein